LKSSAFHMDKQHENRHTDILSINKYGLQNEKHAIHLPELR